MGTRDYCQNMQLGDDAESRETRGKDGCRNERRQGERGCPCPSFQTNDCPLFTRQKGLDTAKLT